MKDVPILYPFCQELKFDRDISFRLLGSRFNIMHSGFTILCVDDDADALLVVSGLLGLHLFAEFRFSLETRQVDIERCPSRSCRVSAAARLPAL